MACFSDGHKQRKQEQPEDITVILVTGDHSHYTIEESRTEFTYA